MRAAKLVHELLPERGSALFEQFSEEDVAEDEQAPGNTVPPSGCNDKRKGAPC